MASRRRSTLELAAEQLDPLPKLNKRGGGGGGDAPPAATGDADAVRRRVSVIRLSEAPPQPPVVYTLSVVGMVALAAFLAVARAVAIAQVSS